MPRPADAVHPALWPSPWPAEDGGPQRRQAPHGVSGLWLQPGEQLVATTRIAIASTMVVLRAPSEVYLLGHTAGDGAVSWVEQIDPVTLETIRRSPDLPGGPAWPGGIAAHANGSLYVVFGRHAHRLSAELEVLVTVELPRDRPYNSFVVLPDGSIATKDFGGSRPGQDEPSTEPCELLVLEPEGLTVTASLTLPEPSVARLSADGSDIYVVGDTALWRVGWNGVELVLDESFAGRYRTLPGQTFGWDAVIDDGAAWFLDDGEGSHRYAGTLRGIGVSTAPLHLVRVGLHDSGVSLTEICGLPGGIVANPPAIDADRRIAVGYDSGNGVVAAFDIADDGSTTPRWVAQLDHGAHPLRFAGSGELVLCHHDRERGLEQIVVLDIETGAELGRVDTGSPVQSVLFGAPGFDRDLYLCTFAGVTRVSVA